MTCSLWFCDSRLEPMPGAYVGDVAEDLCRLAALMCARVDVTFNGVVMHASPEEPERYNSPPNYLGASDV